MSNIHDQLKAIAPTAYQVSKAIASDEVTRRKIARRWERLYNGSNVGVYDLDEDLRKMGYRLTVTKLD